MLVTLEVTCHSHRPRSQNPEHPHSAERIKFYNEGTRMGSLGPCRKYRLTEAESLVSHPGVFSCSRTFCIGGPPSNCIWKLASKLRNTINCNLQTLGKMCQNFPLVSKVRLGRDSYLRVLKRRQTSLYK